MEICEAKIDSFSLSHSLLLTITISRAHFDRVCRIQLRRKPFMRLDSTSPSTHRIGVNKEGHTVFQRPLPKWLQEYEEELQL